MFKNYLKLVLTPLFSFLILISLIPTSHAAGAATLRLSPAAKSVSVGGNVVLQLSINANGESIDTARAVVSYPANLIEVVGFSLNGKLNSTSPGNFSDDNSGQLSVGGFTVGSPLTGAGNFASVTFRAKAAGTATVSLTGSSRLISAGEEKINAGALNSSVITIGARPPALPGEEDNQLDLQSPTHPDSNKWYNAKEAQFTWNDIAEDYFWAYNTDPDTNPTKKTGDTQMTVKKLREGISYFHLKATEGETSHYQIKTDTKAPNRFEPFWEVDSNGKLVIRFATTDSGSGVERYTLKLNDAEPITVTSPHLLTDLVRGTETMVTITAYDFAGNSREGWIRFVINEDGSVREISKSPAVCSLGGLPFGLQICCLFPAFCRYGIWLAIILILWLLYVLKRRQKRAN